MIARALFGPALLGLAIGCSSSDPSTDPHADSQADSVSDSATSEIANDGDDARDGGDTNDADSAMDAPDGGRCNGIGTGAIAPYTYFPRTDPPPTWSGGPIADGIYDLTEYADDHDAGSGCCSGCGCTTHMALRIVVAGDHVEAARRDVDPRGIEPDVVADASTTYATHPASASEGPTLTWDAPSCGSMSLPGRGYTATATSIVFYENDAAGWHRYTFARK